MQVSATLKDASISPQKARLVVDMIRGKSVAQALDILKYTPKKAAGLVAKLLSSAIANAEHNEGADVDALYVSQVMVDEAASLKRFHARAKGRGNRIVKRRSHILVTVSEKA